MGSANRLAVGESRASLFVVCVVRCIEKGMDTASGVHFLFYVEEAFVHQSKASHHTYAW